MSHKKNCAIINPKSGGGRTKRRISEIKKLLDYYFGLDLEIHITSNKYDATEYTSRIVKENPQSGLADIKQKVPAVFDPYIGTDIAIADRHGTIVIRTRRIPDDVVIRNRSLNTPYRK